MTKFTCAVPLSPVDYKLATAYVLGPLDKPDPQSPDAVDCRSSHISKRCPHAYWLPPGSSQTCTSSLAPPFGYVAQRNTACFLNRRNYDQRAS